MKIINKSKILTPDYFGQAAKDIITKARISHKNLRIILKKRNRSHYGEFSVENHYPSGTCLYWKNLINIGFNTKSNKEDLLYVLAHEIGHLKQWKQKQTLVKCESYATRFALKVCNCYPIVNYDNVSKYLKNNK